MVAERARSHIHESCTRPCASCLEECTYGADIYVHGRRLVIRGVLLHRNGDGGKHKRLAARRCILPVLEEKWKGFRG